MALQQLHAAHQIVCKIGPSMQPSEFLDYMLDRMHEYPHKARHYNRILLKQIRRYKRKYRNAVKCQLQDAEDVGSNHRRRKYEKKIEDALDAKIMATRSILDLTKSVLREMGKLADANGIQFSREPPQLHNAPNTIRAGEPTAGEYCVCRGVAHGEMISCDSLYCRIKWFHFKCVSLGSVPKGSWHCPECRKDWRLCRLE